MSVEPRGTNRWRARFRDAHGRQHARHFRTKTEAQDWERDQRAAVRRGEHRDPSAGRVLLAVYAEGWRQEQVQHAPSSARAFEMCLRLHIYPALGHLRMAAVRRSAVKNLVTAWTKTAAPKTVRLRFAVLSALFRSAVLDATVSESPCAGVKLPEVHRKLVVPLSIAQVQALCEAIDPRFRPAVLLGAGCGARASEALGVTKPNVRFLRREVVFDRQVSPRRPWPLVPLKTPSSHAAVPAPQFVLDALAPLCKETGKDGLLFRRESGEAVGAHLLHRAVRAAVQEAGLPADTSFHSLRHFYASTLIDGGASPVVVAARLRHRTPNESLRTYAHLFEIDDERTRRIIGEAWTVTGGDSVGTVNAG